MTTFARPFARPATPMVRPWFARAAAALGSLPHDRLELAVLLPGDDVGESQSHRDVVPHAFPQLAEQGLLVLGGPALRGFGDDGDVERSVRLLDDLRFPDRELALEHRIETAHLPAVRQ